MTAHTLRTGPRSLAPIVPGLITAAGATLVAAAIAPHLKTSQVLAAMVLGILTGNLMESMPGLRDRLRPGLDLCRRRLLRLAVALLGFRFTWQALVAVGATGVVSVVLAVTLLGGAVWLTMIRVTTRSSALLLAVGCAICGASAVAAVGSATDAEESEIVRAMVVVTGLGSVAAIVMPTVGSLAGLTDHAYGWWVGLGVHDVGQVAAAAAAWSPVALEQAIVVKLARVLLLVPLMVQLTRQQAGRREAQGSIDSGSLPLFVIGFALAVVVASSGLLPEATVTFLAQGSTPLLAAALYALGTQVLLRPLVADARRSIVPVLGAWTVCASVLLLAVAILG